MININTNKRIATAFLGCVALAVIFRALNIDILYTIFRAVAGLAFVLFIPGYIATYAFFKDKKEVKRTADDIIGITKEPEGDIDFLERIALSVGLSISLVVLTVMFSNLYLSIPMNFTTIVAEITFICAFFAAIASFQRNTTCMMHYNRLIEKATFAGHPNRKKRLYIMGGVTVIILFMVLDIFYPALFPEVEPAQMQAPVAQTPLNFSEIYNTSMTVYSFYPQKGLAENRTNVTIQHQIVDNFNDKIAFLGYNLDRAEIPADQTFHITYFWKCLEEVNKDYTVFVHVTDLNDTTAFQHDHELPINTSLWKKGDIIMEEYDVRIPKNTEEGSYFIRLGLYSKKNGKRLKLVSGRFIDSNNRAIISRIDVGEWDPEPINESDLYESEKILRFYPQKYITENLTDITIQHKSFTNFDDTIMLLGCNLDKATVKRSETFHITYFWKALKDIGNNYTVFAPITHKDIGDYDFVVSAKTRLTFRHDHEFPLNTSQWNIGDIIMEEYDVTVTDDMEPGTYHISAGLEYNRRKLPIISSKEKTIRAIIADIEITE